MLARFIIKRKLLVGNIKKGKELAGNFWYIPIHVKANNMWNLLVSDVKDVKAIIKYVNNGETHLQKQGSWINEIDGSLESLGIDTQRDIRITDDSTGEIIRPVNSMQGETLEGNFDIWLKFKTGSFTLGYWLFKEAIIEGIMQEISPVKINYEPPASHK